MDEKTLSLTRLLIARLERISADSVWAHRASGVKGSLLKVMESKRGGQSIDPSQLKRLMDLGFNILEKASAERFK